MHLEIKPAADVSALSLCLNGARMGKNKSENTFVALVTKRDRLFDVFYVEDGRERRIETNRDERYVADKRRAVRFRLSQHGAAFLRDAFLRLGPYAFSFYEDDHDPFTGEPVPEVIANIEEAYPLRIGTLIALSAQ